ncbi:single-stranded DNA-binding protein [Paenibacillus glucanolyticus]|uniref:single-stranded DNA-binding protein n=1 Tax=Paenibacillus glucanolyticus TaxID=59843 RepID=UPI000970089E|nr:single-stranded DNA-binding protein [Paenibacillus glucanolyticus]OMF70470.1 single-stranded DNA-binding protein [Paenibacillus glucanolyticus]
MNRACLVGRLTKDPELRYSGNGVGITNFILAVDRPFKSDNGPDADFIPVVTFKQTAEACANYLRKGRLCAVEGRIQVRNYDTDNGKRYVTEVIADNVRFLESSKDNTKPKGDPFQDDGKPIDISDDDLPF